MTVEQYWQMMRRAQDIRNRANAMLAEADAMERAFLKEAGVDCHDREPGFPCWTANGLRRYYNSPHEVLAALANQGAPRQ